MFVLDSHCDTPSQILRLRDLSLDNTHAHVDFPKLKKGGVDGAFFALYVPASLDSDPESAWEYAMKLYACVADTVKVNAHLASMATSPQQAIKNKSQGLFSVFLGLENGSPLGHSIDRLHTLYGMGVRYITLCHSGNNEICDSCAPMHERWGGLSPFGKDLVTEMNRIGMLIDVSHVSDSTFYDVLSRSVKPVVATHSCCRALSSHPRNMSDDMIRCLADAGGVIQINFYPVFLDSSFQAVLRESGIMEKGEAVEAEFIKDPSDSLKREAWYSIQDELKSLARPSFRLIADHIDHVVDIVGIDHVGIGSDFDGIEVAPSGLEDISALPVLFDELRGRGYAETDLEKLASGNFFRIMCQD